MVIKIEKGFNLKNDDWMIKIISKQCGGELSRECQFKIASAIREEIRKRRPIKVYPEEFAPAIGGDFTSRQCRNQAIADYDKALGLEDTND